MPLVPARTGLPQRMGSGAIRCHSSLRARAFLAIALQAPPWNPLVPARTGLPRSTGQSRERRSTRPCAHGPAVPSVAPAVAPDHSSLRARAFRRRQPGRRPRAPLVPARTGLPNLRAGSVFLGHHSSLRARACRPSVRAAMRRTTTRPCAHGPAATAVRPPCVSSTRPCAHGPAVRILAGPRITTPLVPARTGLPDAGRVGLPCVTTRPCAQGPSGVGANRSRVDLHSSLRARTFLLETTREIGLPEGGCPVASIVKRQNRAIRV